MMQIQKDPGLLRFARPMSSPRADLRHLAEENAKLRAALTRTSVELAGRDVVTRELKHRIGNLLAVVHAIARQSFGGSDEACVESFTSRLRALAAAQTFLIDAATHPAVLADVVATALRPHCVAGDRCTIAGPADVCVDGARASALTLALHELATNAAKYGALANDLGHVDVSWRLGDDGTLSFLWRERGGPPVIAPTRRGFGSQLITRHLATAFGGDVDLKFEVSGVVCRLVTAPIAHIA